MTLSLMRFMQFERARDTRQINYKALARFIEFAKCLMRI